VTSERARGFLEAATISDEWVQRMSQRALLLEAHHTTHIEGTQLSVEQAEQVWAGNEVKGTNADDVRELLNYRGAFELVGEYLASGAPIGEGVIREIHERLVRGVRGGKAKPGEWRTIQDYVANDVLNERFGTEFTKADQLLFDQFIEEAKQDKDVVDRALANPLDNFELAMKPKVEELMIDRMDQNQDIVNRYLNDPAFQNAAFKAIVKKIYEQIRRTSTRPPSASR
jgi:hypothetical protein